MPLRQIDRNHIGFANNGSIVRQFGAVEIADRAVARKVKVVEKK